MTCLNSNHGFWLLTCFLFPLHFAQPSQLLLFFLQFLFPILNLQASIVTYISNLHALCFPANLAEFFLFSFAQTMMIFASLFIRSYFLLCCGDKTLTKANAEEKNSLLVYASTALIITDQIQGRTQVGTRRQKVRQRPQKTTAYCIILHGLLTLPYCTTEDYLPRAVITHIRVGSLTSIHQSLIKKTPHRYAHSLNKAILQLRVPLPTSPYFVANEHKPISTS